MWQCSPRWCVFHLIIDHLFLGKFLLFDAPFMCYRLGEKSKTSCKHTHSNYKGRRSWCSCNSRWGFILCFWQTYNNCENSCIRTPFLAKWLDLFGLLSSTQQAGSYDVFSLQIVKLGLMTEAEFDEASRKALRLFEYGQVIKLLLKLLVIMSLLKFDGAETSFTTLVYVEVS